ncbi:MAG: dihydrolipoamide acetyltransferase family protein [Chloroflexota bacterium]
MVSEDKGEKERHGKSVAEVIRLAGWRKTLSERMLASHLNHAEVTQMREADASEMVKIREALVEKWEKEHGFRLSYNHLLVKMTALALKQHPAINSSLEGEEIVVFNDINIGIAVALEGGGLLAPVIRNADQKSLVTLAQEAIALVQQVRSRRFRLDILSGGTFTVTNAGMYGTDFVTPLISAPQSAALGIGRLVQKPVVRDNQIAIRTMMGLSLTYDHRIISGATAAMFFKTLEEIIEHPTLPDMGIAPTG